MPVLKHPIGELYNSVTRPVALTVVRHVMRLTGIPQETSVMYIGDSGAAPLEGATVEGSERPARFNQNNKVYVEVSEEIIPEASLSRFTTQYEQQPIFRDPKLDVTFYPIYARTRQTISLKLRTEDRGTAQRWRNGIHARLSQERLQHSHELNYHYIVPRNCVALLVELFNKRDAVAPYGDTLQDWIRACMTPKAVTLVNAAGQQGRLAIKEKQIRVIGHFDFETPPQEERGDYGPTYTVSCDYIVEYDQPISLVTRFPVSVHSQIIDEQFWKDYKQYTGVYEQALAAYSINNLQRVVKSQTRHQHNPAVSGYLYPPADDWFPPRQYHKCVWIGRFLTTPDSDAPKTLLNLTALGEVSLAPATVAYLKKYPQYATDHRESPIFVKVYEDKDELNVVEFSVDQDLNVSVGFEPDLRKVYHVAIGQLLDLSLLSPDAKDRVIKDPDFVGDLTGDDVPRDEGGVDPDYWDKTIGVDGNDLVRRTVSSYTIIAHRGVEK